MVASPCQYGPFRRRLDAFARQLPGVEQCQVNAVHRARVASRRLRELLPLLALDQDTTRTLNRRLRAVTKQLGAVRELDVLMLLIEEFQQDRQYSADALTRVGAAIANARAAAREHLAAKLPTSKLERLADKLESVAKQVKSGGAKSRRLEGSRPSRTWLWVLEARLARRAARVRSSIEIAGTLYVPERLHESRIAIKKLRYSAELLREVGRPRMTADVAALTTAQDLLGRLHDLEVLLEWGREVQTSWRPSDLTAWRNFGPLGHAIEGECRQWHARYLHDGARLIAIANRLGASMPDTTVADRRAAS
jgi:CHAD domain-containing protein